jgi:hypothetical protein
MIIVSRLDSLNFVSDVPDDAASEATIPLLSTEPDCVEVNESRVAPVRLFRLEAVVEASTRWNSCSIRAAVLDSVVFLDFFIVFPCLQQWCLQLSKR